MSNKLSATLGVGSMSSEIIEAVFRFSNYHRKQLMLISSKNQIDHNGGYVNNWTTMQYMEFINKLRTIYTNSDVKICRDHCGPGFNGLSDLNDTYKTIDCDIENGFDLMHIDFCHFDSVQGQKLEESKKAIEYCLKLKPDIHLEIGTDENTGTNYNLPNLSEIEEEVDFFKDFCNPHFYVAQTGSLITEINQAGTFNGHFIKEIYKILKQKNIKLKEHNADYLSEVEIGKRKGIVDALNIAPQLGVVQTQTVLAKCLIYGVDFTQFLEEVYKGRKWKKWLDKNTAENKFLCSIIAGHYHFASDSYKHIIAQLEQCEDIHGSLIDVAENLINHYHESYDKF